MVFQDSSLAKQTRQGKPILGPRLPPQKRGEGEPGNIRRKSCRLPAPEFGGTNEIAE